MRTELEQLDFKFSNPFEVVSNFENRLSNFFGSKHCILVDCCTHGLELALRATYKSNNILTLPLHTYMSVPMMLAKLSIPYKFSNLSWTKYYTLAPTKIIDAATLWEPNSYIKDTIMVVSFQKKKHIKIGRGGAILLNDDYLANRLRRMRYDGRDLTKNHADDQITEVGYHYYMTPEDAALGILLFEENKNTPAKVWSNNDYIALNHYEVFKNVEVI
jgi:dTDP-4-amino-4,6-dideoxygalactose transaminase